MESLREKQGQGKGKVDNDCNTGRRKAIKKLAAGVGVLAGISMLPDRWTRPIIGEIVIPVHAQTSGEIEPSPEPSPEPQGCNAADGCYNITASNPAGFAGRSFFWPGGTGMRSLGLDLQSSCATEPELRPIYFIALAGSPDEAQSLLGGGTPVVLVVEPVANISGGEGCSFYLLDE